MAADASIVVDTKLDNKGFQAGSAQMKGAIDGLQSEIGNLGKSAQSSINSIAPALQNAAQKAEQFSSVMSRNDFSNGINEAERKVQELSNQVAKIGSAESSGVKTDAQFQRLTTNIQNAEQMLAELQSKMAQLGSAKMDSAAMMGLQMQYDATEAKLEEVKAKLQEMADMGFKAGNTHGLLEEYDELLKKLDSIGEKMAALDEGGKGYTAGAENAEYQKLQETISQLTDELNAYKQAASQMNPSAQPAQETTNALQGQRSELASTEQAFESAGSSASKFGTVVSAIAGAGLNAAKTAVSGLVTGLSTLGHVAVSAGANIAKLPFKAIASGANLAKKALASFGNKAKGTTLTSNGLVKSLFSMKRMLVSRVKRMFISAIFKEVQASLHNLAKYSDEFNQSMSNIKNAARGMGGNLAVTFGNLVNLIAPALSTIINWLSTAISYLNSFFALLSGKSTVTVAKKATDDYAKSLKSAGGAAKDLNDQVYGFDELTKQEDKSGGGGGGSGGSAFEEQDIGSLLPESIQNLFNSIKDAIAAQEWEKVGSLVADGLNWVVVKVDDWINTKFRPEGVKWAGIIARVLNGFVDNFDFVALGKLFADGLNALLDIGYTFLTTFDWARLGVQLANGINSIFNNVDWVLLGNFFAAKLNAIVVTAANLLSNLDWENMGAKLHLALKTYINGIDWDALELAVKSGINGLITIFDTFATGSWLDDLTAKLGKAVGGILKDINWSKLVFDILLGGVRLWGAFWKIVSMIDLPGISAKICEGINSFFAPGSDGQSAFTHAAADAGAGVQGIIDAFAKLTDPNEGINFGNIRSSITSAIRTFMSQIDFAQLIESTGEMIHQLALTVLSLVDEIFSPDDNGETIGQKLANGLNRLFLNENGAVDLTKFQGLGQSFGDAIKGIFNSINDFFEQTDWDAIGTSIGEALAAVDWAGIAGKVIKFLWNALLAAVKVTGGLLGSLISRIFGLEITDTMDTAGSMWAQSLFRSYSETVGEAEKSAEQRTLQAAALLGTGTTQELVSSITDGDDAIYWATSECFYQMLNAIENEDGSQLYDAFAKLGRTPPQGFIDAVNEGLLDEEQLAIIRENGAEIFNAIVDAQTADEVAEIFKQYGLEIPMELCEQMALAQESVSNAGHDLLYKLQEAAGHEDVEAAKQAFADAGIEVTDSFAESIISYGLENMIAALALMGAGVDQATIEAMDMSHLSENLNAYMESSGEDLVTIAKELGSEVGDGIGFTIPDAIAKALGIGTKEVTRVKGEMVDSATATSEDIQAGTQAGEDLGSGSAGGTSDKLEEGQEAVGEATQGVVDEVTDTLTEGQEDTGTAAEGVADSVEDPLSELPENVKPYAETLMQAITQAIIDGDPIAVGAIEAAANAVVNKAAEILSNGKGEEIATDFINGMNNGIIFTYSPLVTNMDEICAQILSEAQVYINEKNGTTIGENMIIGMINGFNNYGQILVNTMAHICGVCVDDARRILGIASPSKVFEQIGGYVMEGMQIGLEDTGKDAINTVGSIADAMVKEAENGNGIAVRIDAMTDGLDTVGDKLSRIADIFIGITDSLTKMGGLPLPTIATGQVIPYGAQAAGNATEAPENGLNASGIEDALYNAITRAQDNDDGEPIVINLVVDGRKFADVVTKYQRQQDRAWR